MPPIRNHLIFSLITSLTVLILSACQQHSPPQIDDGETSTIIAWAPQPGGEHQVFPTFPIAPAAETNLTRPSVFRGEALAVAEAYRRHRWTPTAANIRHGNDTTGIRIDTPDHTLAQAVPGQQGWWQPGQSIRGIPYCWGGFDSLESFDLGLAQGRAAGDIYTSAKRAHLHAAVSREAVGIDCSGLISRCWRLPRAYSTRSLPSLCVPLASLDDLRPGDILNVRNHHVMLFVRWVNQGRHAEVYEVGATPCWRVHRHAVSRELILAEDYRPLRYQRIREDSADGSQPWLKVTPAPGLTGQLALEPVSVE